MIGRLISACVPLVFALHSSWDNENADKPSGGNNRGKKSVMNAARGCGRPYLVGNYSQLREIRRNKFHVGNGGSL